MTNASPQFSTSTTALLRRLPSVNAVMRSPVVQKLLSKTSHEQLAVHARRVLDELRDELRHDGANAEGASAEDADSARSRLLLEAVRRLEATVREERARSLKRVINATGVVLHTNLGRAPLSDDARRRASDEVAGYCTLEYDLATGERGARAPRVEELLIDITGAEAAFVVNNCAAATLLVLAALASDGETIISRGELVEIGGDFRIPDVMRTSHTAMIEVGTTNRTRLADYEQAITSHTRLIARVHPSNYRVVGFTSSPTLAELAHLAHSHRIPLYEDAGSGLLDDLPLAELADEPVIAESVRAGADVVSFSGDKLLGGPQAGIIIGRHAIIERIRRTPLARALRASKFVLGALEATLEAHARGTAGDDIPTLRMLRATYAETERRARAMLCDLHDTLSSAGNAQLTCEVVTDEAAVGGGSAPLARLPTAALALNHSSLTASDLTRLLRQSSPPVIARVAGNQVLLNLRTVSPSEEPELLAALKSLAAAE